MTSTEFFSSRPWLPYVAPMGVFLALTALESYLPRADGALHSPWYPAYYSLKIALVAATAIACRSAWSDLRAWPGLRKMLGSVAIGFLISALWIKLDGHYPTLSALGKRQAFDPSYLAPTSRFAFLSARLFGLVIVIPLIEELFWRSFLVRWLIDADFQRVPIGRVTPMAAAVTAALFALEHPEWLPALLTGFAWAGLLWWSRSISACVASHAAANLGLGIYVLATGDWHFL